MQLNPSEISDLLKKRIEGLGVSADLRTQGTVVSVTDGICRVHGLSDVMQGEMLEFPGNTYGLALNLERDSVGAVILGSYEHISEGDLVKTTGKILSVPVGPELIGRVVNALGQPIDGKGPINTELFDVVEKVAPGVIDRQSVSQPVQTGLKSVDSMIPIGRGQRELIIGDRQCGKTAVAIDTIINYAGSMGMDLVESKVFPSFTLTCTMIGFLSGIVLIPRYVTQKQALVVCSTLGLLLSLGVVLCDFGVTLFGHRANASIFLLNALGLPNALIYAGVWPLAIRGLGRVTKMGSSLLIMGLCGNAILPLVYGFVAERCGMRMGYWVLVPCFLYLVFFAVKGYKIVRWPWQRIENNG